MKKNNRTLTTAVVALAAGVLLACQSGQAQTTFTAGNLVVDRVGNGSAALSSAGTAIFLDEFTLSGTRVQSVALATDGTSVVQSGTASSEGFIHFSADGSSLVVPGYNVSAGTAGVASATSTAVPRAIAAFSLAGTQTSVTQLGSAFSSNNIRSAASTNGSLLFAAGGATGIVTTTAGTNGSTAISANSVNNRDSNVFGGNIYFTTAAGTTGLYEITGTGTSTGQTAKIVAASSSPYGFSVSPDNLTAYVVSGLTLTKFTRSADGGMFNSAYSATIAAGVTGLTVSYGTTNTIYYDNPTNIYATTDSGTVFGSINTVATAGTNTAFRGLDFVPAATAVPEPATVFAGLLLVGALGWNQRRRLRGLAGLLGNAHAA